MATKPEDPQAPVVQVSAGDDLTRGRYSNNMFITHSPEEFILDWLLSSPTGTHLVSRVILSPGHLKRVIAALEDNLRKYEEQFGTVRPAEPDEQIFH
jgi:hypothetical protein